MAPHLVWLVQSDFLPFPMPSTARAIARADRPCLASDCNSRSARHFSSYPRCSSPCRCFSRAGARKSRGGRCLRPSIVNWLAFGPIVTVLAMSALSGRGTVAMWGYPLFFSRPVAGAERAAKIRSIRRQARARRLGGGVRMPGHRIHCQLRDHSELRPPLPGGVLPGRGSRP